MIRSSKKSSPDYEDPLIMDYRKTSQFLMPAVKPAFQEDCYDIYPAFNIGPGKIIRGLKSIAGVLSTLDLILIDGFEGVLFEELMLSLEKILEYDYDIRPELLRTESFLKPACEIDNLIAPFLGGDDPVFGKRATLKLADFFNVPSEIDVHADNPKKPLIIYGPGAALFSSSGFLVYLDLPKNELQFRSRAGTVRNLGADRALDPKMMYKRFYFVDWVVLNNHKKDIISRIDILADSQRQEDLTWLSGPDFRNALLLLAKSPFRVRPWFEPGAWGGSWIRDKIPGVNKAAENYAWSFELITPENGILFQSSGLLTEFSFDFLMYLSGSSVLGDCADNFGTDFPIRFDFLDTFDGGNLSVQCHPGRDYMKENFGEDFTQEESYYILDTKENSGVYLGFMEDISPDKFRKELEESILLNKKVNIEDYVLLHPSHKHDLFLIPPGTIHGSGKNNLVLEISTTPYIYTFKMYDWLRPDLDGKPRPLNIGRGMENLFFDRKGKKAKEELLSNPVLEVAGDDWKLYNLPTNPAQLYGIRRCHFDSAVEFETGGKFYVMSLVEGSSIIIETSFGTRAHFSYAETFIIPAAAGSFRMTNNSDSTAIIIMAFVK